MMPALRAHHDRRSASSVPAIRNPAICASFHTAAIGVSTGGNSASAAASQAAVRSLKRWRNAQNPPQEQSCLQQQHEERATHEPLELAPVDGQDRRVPVGEVRVACLPDLLAGVPVQVARVRVQDHDRPSADQNPARPHRPTRLLTTANVIIEPDT